MNFLRPDHRFDNLWIAGIKGFHSIVANYWIAPGYVIVAPCDEYPSFSAFELDPVGQLVAYNHLYAVSIFCVGGKDPVNIPKPALWKLCVAPNLNRTCE